MKTAWLQKFRRVGIVEGLSTIILFAIAMPLKYMYDMPMAVKIVGSVHGLLFVCYCILLLVAASERKWTFGKMVLLFFGAVIPFGPFVAEVWLKKEYEEAQQDEQGGIASE